MNALAHHDCTGRGIEIGAAAHNPFHLADCQNVADNPDAYELYKRNQIEMCGSYAEVDLWSDAASLAEFFNDEEFDYIISSHMIEHHPNPLRAIAVTSRSLAPRP